MRLPYMSPVHALDGTSMTDPGATGQALHEASQLRQHVLGVATHDSINTQPAGGPTLPDLKLCLLQQKLQMLDCCMADGLRDTITVPCSAVVGTGGDAPAVRLHQACPLTSDVLMQQQHVARRAMSPTAGTSQPAAITSSPLQGSVRKTALAVAVSDVVQYMRAVQGRSHESTGGVNSAQSLQAFLQWYLPPDAIGVADSASEHGTGPAPVQAPQLSAANARSPHKSVLTGEEWACAWQQARQLCDQEADARPLFDRVSEAEKALHYLETATTPSMVMVQALAAVISTAAYLLQRTQMSSTAGKLASVEKACAQARSALLTAAEEVKELEGDRDGGGVVVAGEIIHGSSQAALLACTKAWQALEQAETTLIQGQALLHVLPLCPALVDSLLDSADHASEQSCHSAVGDTAEKASVANLMSPPVTAPTQDKQASQRERQQQPESDPGDSSQHHNQPQQDQQPDAGTADEGGGRTLPAPALREYVITQAQQRQHQPSDRLYARADHCRVCVAVTRAELDAWA
eukprot:TRINITY_DN3342_c0_g1_i4.p2 TRINITY_DN3342_c0_g1~~TRINITY_DN3342_c0_g1_i4.p2  ORF type:complete len:520 (-),score=93.11 TRINITY_DN3342_c0_g1_i4:110-1669(-)